MPKEHRILIVTIGSRGDVQPYIAFANRLVRFGHTVAIATHERFRPFVGKHGPDLEFLPLEGDPGAIMSSKEFQECLFEGSNMDLMKLMLAESKKYTYKNHLLIYKHAQSFQPSGVVAGFVNYPECLAVCQKLNIPLLDACTVPVYPSEHTLPVGTADPTTIGWINKFANYAMWKMQWLIMGPDVNKFRQEVLQLPKAGQQHFDAAPMFNMLSSVVFPPPPDYPSHVITTGYWIMPANDYTPSAELDTFLSSGEPPVYMGFGSMPVKDPSHLLHEFGKALEKLGMRGIYCGGWTDIEEIQAPDNVLMISGAPHEWLLPRCAAAIHHGGAGTTAASMRAGIPTIICPVLIDQPFWASRVVTLGNGQNKIKPMKEVDHEFLEDQLKHCMTEEVRKTAKEVGEKLQQEDGCKEAAAYTVGYLNERYKPNLPQLNYMADSDSSVCPFCNANFTLFFRRHHCMSCGSLACGNCVKYLDVTNYTSFRYCCKKCAGLRGLSWE